MVHELVNSAVFQRRIDAETFNLLTVDMLLCLLLGLAGS